MRFVPGKKLDTGQVTDLRPKKGERSAYRYRDRTGALHTQTRPSTTYDKQVEAREKAIDAKRARMKKRWAGKRGKIERDAPS